MLNNDTIAVTVMSNSGLINALEQIGIKCVQTKVGDRFVYESMQENDYCLGGEQSGHIILKKYATTGDGLLTAIMIAEELCDRKSTLSNLTEALELYPQYTRNIRVKNKAAVLSDEEVLNEVKEIEKLINKKGRVLLRQSGTEPLIRIMIECESEDNCIDYSARIASVIEKRGHGVE